MSGPLVPAPCRGVCNRAWRQAARARDANGLPVPHQLTPEPGAPHWCPRCAHAIGARLGALDDLTAMLEAEIAGRRAGTDAPVTGTKGRASPSPAVDDIDEITRTLEAWEAAYRELRRFTRAPARPADHRVIVCVAWLSRHLPGILTCDLGADFGEEVTRLHRMAATRCATNPAKVRKPVPCPRCDLRTLVHHGGDRHVVCENPACGRLMTLSEYDAHTVALAARR